MKSFRMFFATIISALLLVSCGASSPSDVAVQSFEHLYAGEIDKYLELVDATAKRKENLREMYKEKGPKMMERMEKRTGKPKKIHAIKETISDDGKNCKVDVEIIFEKGAVENEIINLALVDGKWLVEKPIGDK